MNVAEGRSVRPSASEPGIVVGAVTGPTSTLFCPAAVLPPLFEHW
jgi:hypothetical protein